MASSRSEGIEEYSLTQNCIAKGNNSVTKPRFVTDTEQV